VQTSFHRLSTRYSLIRLAASMCAALLVALGTTAHAQNQNDLSAFVGRWQINLGQTRMNRGNHITRSDSFTFVFELAKAGLMMHVYANYPQAAPTRSNLIIPDQKSHQCESSAGCLTVGGTASDQSYSYSQISSHMLIRVFYVKGKVDEYSTYSVSADGKTFTMIAWGAEAPDRQNVQVFSKQLE